MILQFQQQDYNTSLLESYAVPPANEAIDQQSHDFDVISHESCSYDDPGKGLQVDVEQVVGKIFGSNQVY